MKEKIKNIKFNKKTIIIIAIVLVIVVAIIFGLTFLKKEDSQEQKLTNELKELGVDFYENFYYDQISSDDKERSEFLEKYVDIGIKINLDNLSRFKTEETEEIVKKFVNDDTKKECDRTSSMVIIYPKEPYEKDSYTIDVILECGYEDKK